MCQKVQGGLIKKRFSKEQTPKVLGRLAGGQKAKEFNRELGVNN